MRIQINIYKIRTEKKISLRQLADLSGLGKSTINYIENGKKSPTLDTLIKIAQALREDVKNLYDVVEDES